MVKTERIEEKRMANSRASSSILESPLKILFFSATKKLTVFKASVKSL